MAYKPHKGAERLTRRYLLPSNKLESVTPLNKISRLPWELYMAEVGRTVPRLLDYEPTMANKSVAWNNFGLWKWILLFCSGYKDGKEIPC
jgi:hypothetical protein